MLAFLEMIEEEDKKIFRKGKMEGRREGKREGKIEGKRENKIEIAKAMLKENMSIDIIAKITKLSEKQIDKLK